MLCPKLKIRTGFLRILKNMFFRETNHTVSVWHLIFSMCLSVSAPRQCSFHRNTNKKSNSVWVTSETLESEPNEATYWSAGGDNYKMCCNYIFPISCSQHADTNLVFTSNKLRSNTDKQLQNSLKFTHENILFSVWWG